MSHSSNPERLKERLENLQPANPLRRSWVQRRSFDAAWLTTERPLSNMQRLGFLAISAFMGISGCAMLSAGLATLREGDVATGFILSFFSVCIVLVAIKGMWRVWRDIFAREQDDIAEPEHSGRSSSRLITPEYAEPLRDPKHPQ